jgi:hypothetical protein
MSGKIWLSIVVVILLIGTVVLIAQEKQAGPEQGQRRGQRQRLRAQGQTPATSEPADIDVAPGPRRMKQGQAGISAEPNRPTPQRFDRLLNALTKAYQENDREQMGLLIRKMHQARKELRERREARQQRRQDASEREMDRRRPGRFQPGPERWNEGFGPRHSDRPRPQQHTRGPRYWGPPEHMDRPEHPRPWAGRGWRNWDRAPRRWQRYDDYPQEWPDLRRGWRSWDRGRRGWDNYDYPEERQISPRRWDDDVRSEWDW